MSHNRHLIANVLLIILFMMVTLVSCSPMPIPTPSPTLSTITPPKPTNTAITIVASPSITISKTSTSTSTSTLTPTKTATLFPTEIDFSLLTSPIIQNAYQYYFDNKETFLDMLPYRVSLYDMMPHENIFWPFLVYEPGRIKSRNILVITPNTGNWNFQDDDNFITQYNAAVWALNFAIPEANRIGAILLVPVFPRFSIPHTFGAQYLDRFVLETKYIELKDVDLQLIRMAELIIGNKREEGIDLSDKLLFTGYSAQSWFSSRFLALNPNRVQAITIGGCAWPTVPVAEYKGIELPFPLGIGSIEEYDREIPDIEDYKRVNIYYYWGTKDGYIRDGMWDFGPISEGYQQYSNSYMNAWFFNSFGNSAEELYNSNKEILNSITNNVTFDLFIDYDHSEVFNENYSNAVKFLIKHAEYFKN